MEKQDLELRQSASLPNQKPTELQEQKIARCIAALVHACRCRDANCRLLSCGRLKRVVQHHKSCRRLPRSACAVCRQFMALCIYHAKQCEARKCLVPFCMKIRFRLKKLDCDETGGSSSESASEPADESNELSENNQTGNDVQSTSGTSHLRENLSHSTTEEDTVMAEGKSANGTLLEMPDSEITCAL